LDIVQDSRVEANDMEGNSKTAFNGSPVKFKIESKLSGCNSRVTKEVANEER
jgi:hypothetical protein